MLCWWWWYWQWKEHWRWRVTDGNADVGSFTFLAEFHAVTTSLLLLLLSLLLLLLLWWRVVVVIVVACCRVAVVMSWRCWWRADGLSVVIRESSPSELLCGGDVCDLRLVILNHPYSLCFRRAVGWCIWFKDGNPWICARCFWVEGTLSLLVVSLKGQSATVYATFFKDQ